MNHEFKNIDPGPEDDLLECAHCGVNILQRKNAPDHVLLNAPCEVRTQNASTVERIIDWFKR